ESRNLLARPLRPPRLADELIDRRHFAFTLVRARGPASHGAQGPGIAARAGKTRAQTKNAPFSPSPGDDVRIDRGPRCCPRKPQKRSCTSRLTVQVAAAASELLASRRGAEQPASKPLRSQ